MANVSTTFQSQGLQARLRKVGREIRRLHYPLSENSEPLFDLERYGASSHHSGSTRHSSSTFRRPTHDEFGRPLPASRGDAEDFETEDIVDIVVVEKKDVESQHTQDGDLTTAHEHQTTVHGSERGSTPHSDYRRQHHSWSSVFLTRIVPAIQYFFVLNYQDPAKERHYIKESWFLSKRIAIYTSLYFYIAWILLLALYPRPWAAYDWYSWVGIIGFFVLPLLPAVLLDLPVRSPWLWRIFLFGTTWSWPFLIALQLKLCGFYTSTPTCGDKDFVGLFYYLIAMPTMALFALQQSRLLHMTGTLASLIFIAVVLIPYRSSWIRHFFNFLSFQIFMTYISYAREKSDRKVFTLRDQLKTQYKATQKAQASESRASDSKKRFVNYIFHEVRVPLNTALLSIQNLIGEEVFKNLDEENVELVDVLQSSLSMMEKVLNDVLDFNRMEAGKLLYTSSPFDFTKVIRSVLLGVNVAAASKHVVLESRLDPQIEQIGDLVGDEMRLRQVLSNLTSNACKFTSPGGSVTIITKLIHPSTMKPGSEEGEGFATSASSNCSIEALDHSRPHQRLANSSKVTIRMEVHDTGIGIKPSDVARDRLFSPYVQTEIGKRQGGKGTGLGLALVRNIVQLSGGRLGLRSRPGHGSVFWIEQEFGLVDSGRLTSMLSKNDMHQEAGRPCGESEKAEDAKSETSTSFEKGAVESVSPVTSANLHDKATMSEHSKQVPCNMEPMMDRRPNLTQLHSSEIVVVDDGGQREQPSNAALSRPYSPGDETIATPSNAIAVALDPDLEPPLHILVVDDDLLTRRLMSRMITRLGHVVETAENGLLALNSLREHLQASETKLVPFDLVFLDNQMPVLTGVEMVSRAREEGLDTMVCGVTGNAMKEDQDEYLENGADFVLTKPVMEVNVKRMLQIAQERRRNAQLLKEESR